MLATGTRITLYALGLGVYPNGMAINFGPVTSGITGALCNDATGSVTVYDANNNPVTGATTITLTSTGSGMYQAIISGSSFNPPPGDAYTAVFSLTSGTAGSGSWAVPVTVIIRSQ